MRIDYRPPHDGRPGAFLVKTENEGDKAQLREFMGVHDESPARWEFWMHNSGTDGFLFGWLDREKYPRGQPTAPPSLTVPMPDVMKTWAAARADNLGHVDVAEYVRQLIRDDLRRMDFVLVKPRTPTDAPRV